MPGQYFDREMGTHYNYFRDYDPATGRYVQSDPIELRGGLNTYGYVGAHPIYSIDPLGCLELCKRIIAGEWRGAYGVRSFIIIFLKNIKSNIIIKCDNKRPDHCLP